ncbi:MAG: PD40 domain-containing protein [Candidatus Eremiobacteraeota bacterium]|nr:PD40 domain-containing protein [Candidatus Eremiobacteraeota bacterium]
MFFKRQPLWFVLWSCWMLLGLGFAVRSLRVTNLSPANPQPKPECSPSLSGDGRKLAFEVARPGTDFTDLCVLDLATGKRLVLGSDRNESSQQPRLDRRGQRLAFASFASDWTPGDDNSVSDVFLYDLNSERVQRLVPPNPLPGVSASYRPCISRDGRQVAFFSYGVPDPGTTRGRNVCLWREGDRAYSVVDHFRGRGPVLGTPSLSPRGDRLAFSCFAYDLLPKIPADIHYDVYLMPLTPGAQWPPAEARRWENPILRPMWPVSLLSHRPDGGSANGNSLEPVLLENECIFSSLAGNLVPHDLNDCHDLFVRDLSKDGQIRCLTPGADDSSFEPCATPDGHWLAFTSYATNLVVGTPKGSNVFLLDRRSGKFEFVHSGHSPTIAEDGRSLALVDQGKVLLWTRAAGIRELP